MRSRGTGGRRWLVFFLAGASLAARADVVINEIMYHPPSDDETQEWIELWNNGPTAETLTGWQIFGAFTYFFPAGKTIEPNGFLVIAKSVAAFQALYPTSTADVIGDYAGQLSNSGDEIRLYDSAFATVDIVAYDDGGHWPAAADGDGPSLELINPRLDNSIAQSWAEGIGGGTPGLPNARFDLDPPPILIAPSHSPAAPTTADPITVTVRVYDDSAATSVSLYYKHDESTGPFSHALMFDDGASSDGAAGDGVYGAVLPPQPQGTILEFWMRARDDSFQTRDAPMTAPVKNFLLQVDDEDLRAYSPVYRIVMKAEDHELLHTRNPWSNVLLNATFVANNRSWYNVGVRFRGKGSRNDVRIRKSYRVQFSEAEPFGEIENLNLNAQFIRCQHLDMSLCRRAGLPAPDTHFAYLVFKFHDVNSHLPYYENPDPDLYNLPTMGWRLRVEDINRKFLRKWYPGNSNGNLYRGNYRAPDRQADWTYYGPDPGLYRSPYEKKTNEEANDYSDVIALCDVFTNTTDTLITQALQERIDVDSWWLYWSCMAMMNIEETQIYNRFGDDYFIYFNPATSPPLAKAELLPWDLDEANLTPDKTIFSCTLPNVRRFVENPDFTPKYFRYIQHLLDNYYTLDIMLPAVAATAAYGGFEVPPIYKRDTIPVDELTHYVFNRIAFLERVISRELIVNAPGTVRVGGEYVSFNPTVNLSGRGVTAWTRWVTVNGFDAGYQHLTGNWGDYPVTLQPGLNTYVVECLTTAGLAITTDTLKIRYSTTPNALCGTLAADMTLTAADGPYCVTCDLIVPDGVTLTIEPGASVLLNPTCSIFVFGTLRAIGTRMQPITFGPAAGGTVQQTLIHPGAVWRYDDTGTDRGTAWRAIGYNDSGWLSGPAQLGYGDGDEATGITMGPTPSIRYPCYYFRHRFDLIDPSTFASLDVQVVRDDGCVVYLNGNEIGRSSMAAGPVAYDTLANRIADPASGENDWHPLPPPDRSLLVPGMNTVAVEVHQAYLTSSDVSFDLQLVGEQLDPHWGVIAFYGADAACQMSHCEFSGGSMARYGGRFYGGMISVADSTVELFDCRFSDHKADALSATSGNGLVNVQRCRFEESGNTAIRAEDCPLAVENSTFLFRSQGTARAIAFAGRPGAAPLLRGNKFRGGVRNLIVLDSCNATIKGNWIHDAGDAGVQLTSPGLTSMDHNVIYDCGRGVVVRNGASVRLDHCTLHGNETGIEARDDTTPPGSAGGTATVINTIVWASQTPVRADAHSSANGTYSDVEGDYPGTGNFALHPQFINVGLRDFRIQQGSPCAHRGEGGTYVGAFPALQGTTTVRHWMRY